MADAINFGATISAFASGLAATAAGARILYALARHTPFERALGTTTTRTGAPAGALVVVLTIGVGAIAAQRIAGVSAVNAFFYPGTLGVLTMLVAYLVTNVGAIRYLFIAARRAPVWEIVIPLAGIAFIVYTIYKNVQGVPFPYDRFPFWVAGFLLIGLIITLVTPKLARRVGEALVHDAGLDEAPADG
jgi:amino acid transporter